MYAFLKWKKTIVQAVSSVPTCHHFSSRMYALGGGGGGEKSTLCTLVIMMKIMVGPFIWLVYAWPYMCGIVCVCDTKVQIYCV